jgi:hypothetical protein
MVKCHHIVDKILALALFTTIALLTGCISTDQIILDNTSRQPTAQVEVFKGNQQPGRPYKVIAELSCHRSRQYELKAEASFIDKAKFLGGDAILFSGAQTGEHREDNGSYTTTWVFLSKVIVFLAPQ